MAKNELSSNTGTKYFIPKRDTKAESSVFIPYIGVPYGIIELSKETNNPLLPVVYMYLVINRNMLGKVETSVARINKIFVKAVDPRYKKEREIIAALAILSNCITRDNEADDKTYGEILNKGVVEVKGYQDLFEVGDIGLSEADKVSKEIVDKVVERKKLFHKEDLSIRFWGVGGDDYGKLTFSGDENVLKMMKEIKEGFVKVYIDDYEKIVGSYCKIGKNGNDKPEFDLYKLVGTYLEVKKYCDRNQFLNRKNRTDGDNGANGKNRELNEFVRISKTDEKYKYCEKLSALGVLGKAK